MKHTSRFCKWFKICQQIVGKFIILDNRYGSFLFQWDGRLQKFDIYVNTK